MPGLSALSPEIRALRPVQTLEENLAKGRLAHAILLKGEDLGLLEDVAAAIAASLFETTGNPLDHPDCFTLRPAKRARFINVGKRNDDAPNTMRSLIREINQSANQGGYKVAIVYEADRMNAAAANAFLKTLEEPPRQTVILLLSTRPYELMETIRSRCFQFKIPSRIRQQTGADWDRWLEDYRGWIKWLHADSHKARSEPQRTILQAYGLIHRFTGIVEEATEAQWKAHREGLPEHMTDEEVEAARIGFQKSVRDKRLIDIEEHTRLAAIELSHEVPFPALPVARAIAALESVTGLLALNMKDDAALEAFFLKSLKVWAA